MGFYRHLKKSEVKDKDKSRTFAIIIKEHVLCRFYKLNSLVKTNGYDLNLHAL